MPGIVYAQYMVLNSFFSLSLSLQYHSNNFYFKLAVPFFTTIPSVAFSHMARPSMVNMQSRKKPFLTLGVLGKGGGGGGG